MITLRRRSEEFANKLDITVTNLLVDLRDKGEIDEWKYNRDREVYFAALEKLSEEGLATGIKFKRDDDGEIINVWIDDLEITDYGMSYLEELLTIKDWFIKNN